MSVSTPDYDRIVEANRVFYEQGAELYDATETCLETRYTEALERELDQILAVLPANPRALDACGGSGNVALRLAARRIPVTLVDVSPRLISIAERKARSLPVRPEFIQSEIGYFLSTAPNSFDLITFSSALHHLQDIEGVLWLAFQSLRPGGLLFTIYDPTPRDALHSLTKAALKLDYLAFKVLQRTADLPSAIARRISRAATASGELTSASAGVLAEYHLELGIDDFALVAELERIGYEVLRHHRYGDARYGLIRKFVTLQRDVTQFTLLLRRPGCARAVSAASSCDGVKRTSM